MTENVEGIHECHEKTKHLSPLVTSSTVCQVTLKHYSISERLIGTHLGEADPVLSSASVPTVRFSCDFTDYSSNMLNN